MGHLIFCRDYSPNWDCSSESFTDGHHIIWTKTHKNFLNTDDSWVKHFLLWSSRLTTTDLGKILKLQHCISCSHKFFLEIVRENNCLSKIIFSFIFGNKKALSWCIAQLFLKFSSNKILQMKSVAIFLIFTWISSGQLQTFDANAFCKGLANRYYPYPGSTDCTQYVKCYPYGGVMVGAVYTCMGTTLFNPVLLYCQDGYVPPTTTTVVPSTTEAPTTTSKTKTKTTTTT